MTPTQIGRLKLMLEAHLRDLSSRLRNRENIAVERTPDVVDNVEAAEERDRHLESGQVFPSSYSWWNQRWIVSLAGPL